MGKKRVRVPGEPRPSSKSVNSEATAQHTQTLEDDVREQRDVQFALEKKQSERTKRRRMTSGIDLSSSSTDKDNSNENDSNKPSSSGVQKRIDARTAGLQMWRNAALRRKAKKAKADDIENENENEEIVDSKTSAKIMKQAREQRAEIRAENNDKSNEKKLTNIQQDKEVDAALRTLAVTNNESEDEDDNSAKRNGLGFDDSRSMGDTDFDWRSTVGEDERDLEFLDGSKVTEADELALGLFNTGLTEDNRAKKNESNDDDGAENYNGGEQRIMLADIILQKIQEKEEANARAAAIAADPEKAERDRKISEVYGLVGNIMSKYRSGKVPKAFKIIPKIQNWEELLYLTRPDEWSPAAVYVATRILSSNLSGKEVVSFYKDILLPRCLDDISATKKLNYHLYQSLVKAVYKPDAFCKGILFPMCDDGGCTLRQVTVIASVVSRVSIPMLHSAAALLYMCQLRFNIATCLLVTALLEKKYALPYRVLDTAVKWFVRMKEDERRLPVAWHNCLLMFAQRYKIELTMEQKEDLKILMRVHTHKLITPEIRRELFSARNRGDTMDPDATTIARNIASAAMMD